MGLLQPFAPPSAGKETAPGARKMWTDFEKQQPGWAGQNSVRKFLATTYKHFRPPIAYRVGNGISLPTTEHMF